MSETRNAIPIILSVIAALMNGVGYVLYNIRATKGNSVPNPASWIIWTVMALIDTFWMADATGNWVTAAQFAIGTVGCIATFSFLVGKGKMRKPKPIEWVIVSLEIPMVVTWLVLGHTQTAGWILLLIYLVSFCPMVREIRTDPNRESAGPWAIWTAAYVLLTVNLLLYGKSPSAIALAVLLMLGHGLVGFLSRDGRREKRIL
ncbi:hypothetical protein JW899_04835 [Candidatus Uhrbacteria bacterium]|nr:hypothetical protein [Candidatus Uhrbacteria bacterium]